VIVRGNWYDAGRLDGFIMFRFMVVYMVAIFTFVPGAEAVEEPDSLDEAVVEVGETSIDMLLRRVQKLEGENAELCAKA